MIDAAPLATNSDTHPYIVFFGEWIKRQAGKEPAWVTPLRKEALACFSRLGFPTRHLEEWKYTNVAPIAREPFHPADHIPSDFPKDQVETVTLHESKHTRLVFINGVYSKELSSLSAVPARVGVGNLADAARMEPGLVREHLGKYAPYSQNGFSALNMAFHRDGAFIHLPAGTSVEDPIHLIFISFSQGARIVAQPRNLIIAEEGSRAAFVETYLSFSGAPFLTNAVTEVSLAKGARVKHYKVQEEDGRGYHVATTHVAQEEGSEYRSLVFEAGGALARNSLNVVLKEEGAECHLLGLALASGSQHLDNQTLIHHAKPHTTSRQLYKGILDGKSTSVFNGKIVVEQGAQKTDARQTTKNLLLSDEATADARPQLEIFADDVKCAHGAAVGQLDEAALFYLKSRGIGQGLAQSILTAGFASEVTDKISVESLRARLSRVPRIKFSTVLPGGA